MWFPSSNATSYLNKKLGLNPSGFEQDWEIELSDENRVAEFLEHYQTGKESTEIRQALAALILSSFEDSAWARGLDMELWEIMEEIISKDFEILKPVCSIWLPSEEDGFKISTKIETLFKRLAKKRE